LLIQSLRRAGIKIGSLEDLRSTFAEIGLRLVPSAQKIFLANSNRFPLNPFIGLISTLRTAIKFWYSLARDNELIATSSPNMAY
jgi:hypothetical protein